MTGRLGLLACFRSSFLQVFFVVVYFQVARHLNTYTLVKQFLRKDDFLHISYL
jgi:hypothetical protein